MFRKFLPHEFSFFDMLEEQVAHAVKAAELFKEVAAGGVVQAEAVQRMHDIEHQGDEAAHKILDRLNRTFITPIDREDIYALTKELDDITDMLHTIVRRMQVYKLSGGLHLVEFAAVIEESTNAVLLAVKGLRNMKEAHATHEACVEVHRLENLGDTMRDAVLGELFETEKDAIKIIKWKEIYQDAETTLDICEDVAHVVQGIMVRNT